MNFVPYSDEELQTQSLLTPGTYQFQVVNAEDGISRKGNEQIKLSIKIWDEEGKENIIFDYILAAFPRKLKSFCKATNLLDKYETGNLEGMDCLDKAGVLKLGIQKGKPYTDKDGMSVIGSDRNQVTDYLDGEAAEKERVVQAKAELDDDLPF